VRTHAILVFMLCATAFAQEHKVLINRAALIRYPEFARRARIQGDARITLRLRSDGGAEITEVKSHPLFEKTVRESIPGFRFVCADCFGDTNAQFTILVRFNLTELDTCSDGSWRNRLSSPTQVDVLAGSAICEEISQTEVHTFQLKRLQ
jgi:hypothetical protein